MIKVENLTKYYGKNCAVKDLTFHAEKGEVLGFLGPNGAGKTTTMRILTGYMPPTSGKVTIGGYDVIDQSLEVRRIVGYLPESVPLYPDMRVNEYLRYMGKLHQVDRLEERVAEVIEKVNIADRAHSFISKLSKGMRQRVGLAQALIHDPEVLILDEPTIGLDPAQIIEVRKLIGEIGREKTVLLSTHILSEAQQICDRVLIINRGQLVAEDTPEALQKRLTGTQKVTVQLANDPTSAIEILRGIEDVLHVEINAQNHIILESSGATDIRPKVIAMLTAANLEILEVYSETASLEDIFLQLVQEEETERQAQPELEGALEAEPQSSEEPSEQEGENHA